MLARVKLKGIDGGPHKRWSMWFNSMQREEPYQGLTCRLFFRKKEVLQIKKQRGHRWCMAVVSSCREISRPLEAILLINPAHNGETLMFFLLHGQYRGKFSKLFLCIWIKNVKMLFLVLYLGMVLYLLEVYYK